MLYLSRKRGYQKKGGTLIIMNMHNVNYLCKYYVWVASQSVLGGRRGRQHLREKIHEEKVKYFWRLHFSELPVKSTIVSSSIVYCSRSQWQRGLRRGFAAARLLGILGANSAEGWMSSSESLCCQVEICAWRWSFVQSNSPVLGADHSSRVILLCLALIIRPE